VCAQNDIVVAKSVDGITWTAPVALPRTGLAALFEDRLLPPIAFDPVSRRRTAPIAVAYRTVTGPSCAPETCSIGASMMRSTDGGASYNPTVLAGPRAARELPVYNGESGSRPVLGDQLGLSFVGQAAVPVFVVPLPGAGGVQKVAVYTRR
jgi:hypothetical protein